MLTETETTFVLSQ